MSSYAILLTIFLLLFSHNLFSQSSFYIQSGSSITKVENGNTSQINAKEWQVRLYKREASASGTSYWGIIKGNTASEVMETLKKQQQFELDFNKFIGKGSVEDDVYTHFNPLGPIAVTDAPKASELPLTDEQKNVTDLYAKANDIFYTGLDIKNNLDVIIKGEENPYADIGSNFMQYSDGLKDAVLQIRVLDNLLTKHTGSIFDNIDKKIKEIDRNLDGLRAKQKQVSTAIDKAKQKKSAKSGNEFYVFMTITLAIKPKESQFSSLQSPKTLYVISKPVFYSGRPDNDMQNEKKQFISDIQKHFSDNAEMVEQILNKIPEVHATKPYSTQLIKQNAECYEAIEDYKATVKEALEGLTQYDFLQL